MVSEAAQRISRLALGASTENVHSDPYAQMTDAELASELERLGPRLFLHPFAAAVVHEIRQCPVIFAAD